MGLEAPTRWQGASRRGRRTVASPAAATTITYTNVPFDGGALGLGHRSSLYHHLYHHLPPCLFPPAVPSLVPSVVPPRAVENVRLPIASKVDVQAPGRRHGGGIRFATLTAALALATVSGGFSITGMTSIFVGAYWSVVGMGLALEVGKLAAVAWLGHQRGMASWRLRAALTVLVAVLMGLNVVGAFGFLAKAHIAKRGRRRDGRLPAARPTSRRAFLCRPRRSPTSPSRSLSSTQPGRSRRPPPAIYGPPLPSTPRQHPSRQPPSSAPRMMSAGRPSAPAWPTSLRLRPRPSPSSRSRKPGWTATGRSQRPTWVRCAIWQTLLGAGDQGRPALVYPGGCVAARPGCRPPPPRSDKEALTASSAPSSTIAPGVRLGTD